MVRRIHSYCLLLRMTTHCDRESLLSSFTTHHFRSLHQLQDRYLESVSVLGLRPFLVFLAPSTPKPPHRCPAIPCLGGSPVLVGRLRQTASPFPTSIVDNATTGRMEVTNPKNPLVSIMQLTSVVTRPQANLIPRIRHPSSWLRIVITPMLP